jgi:DNA-binding NtrC family response regulator
MVREDRFREDLLFRLNVVRLQLPPLRSRGEDVRLLLKHFLNSFSSQLNKPVKGFSAKALRILLDYLYPGNVRELKNIVEYAVNICLEEQIQVRHLPAYLTDPEFQKCDVELEAAPSQQQIAEVSWVPDNNANMSWNSIERKMIVDALMKTKGHRSRTAVLLGWGRSTLYRKMRQYGLDEPH